MTCSTLTRTLEILRLFSFSFLVRSFWRGCFRLICFSYLRLIALKASILMQGDMVWIRNVFHVDYFFVMRFAKVGLAEVGNSLFLDCDNHHIPGAVNFLLATVVQSLFFRLFRYPTPPLVPSIMESVASFWPYSLFLNFFGSL